MLNLKQTNSLTNLQFQGTPNKLVAASVSNHLPKVDPSILDDLNNDYCSDFTIDPEKVANRLASINVFKALGPDGLPLASG